MMFGLESVELEQMKQIFALYPQVDRVDIFGSRAKGNFKPWSDIDLALYGKNINLEVMNGLDMDLDDLMLPVYIDLVAVNQLQNEALKSQIQQRGKVLFQADLATENPLYDIGNVEPIS